MKVVIHHPQGDYASFYSFSEESMIPIKNPMFVEDAGRRLKTTLEDDERWNDFWVRIEHHESLHAHDAVGVFTKGEEDGYQPVP